MVGLRGRFPVDGPRGQISDGGTAGSDLRWWDRGVRSPMVGSRGQISDGWTAGSDLRWWDRGVRSPMVGARGRISFVLRSVMQTCKPV